MPCWKDNSWQPSLGRLIGKSVWPDGVSGTPHPTFGPTRAAGEKPACRFRRLARRSLVDVRLILVESEGGSADPVAMPDPLAHGAAAPRLTWPLAHCGLPRLPCAPFSSRGRGRLMSKGN